MFTTLTKLAASLITGTALGVAALAGAGAAAADNPALSQRDATFLSQIQAEGIGYTSPQVALHNAQLVCQDLAAGRTAIQEGNTIMTNSDLNTHQAAFFIVDSVKTYCPQNTAQLNA